MRLSAAADRHLGREDPIIITMALERICYGKLALVLLIVYSTLTSQSAASTIAHTHRGVPSHCCGACHAGHLPLVAAANAVKFAIPLSVSWLEVSNADGKHELKLIVLRQSRAPPV